MARKRWIAVPRDNPEDFYIEDSQAAVEFALMAEMDIDYYAITLTPDDIPLVEPRVEVHL